MRHRLLLAGVTLACCAVPAASARGDGLPILNIPGATNGVRSHDGAYRYVAAPHGRTTTVKAIAMSGVLSVVLAGRFDVPVVAYDGSPSGLSADGRTLVLIAPRRTFPQRSTELAVLDASTLRRRALVPLRGDFSFDAISPSGAWVYLIQYTSAVDPTQYRVRALNLGTGRLLSADIVDPHDRGEHMHGNPLTRISSPDGRWAYTLYDGNGLPFVHALDTAGRRARCIDVAVLPVGANPWSARLTLTGQRLAVVLGGQTLTTIDTRSLAVLASGHPAPRRRAPVKAAAQAHTMWAAIPIAAFALVAIAILVIRRRVAPVPPQAPTR
ncbi:MAG: hypothetical protein QOG59_3254 [Solirubrobacteraceae bacterium]|jgi:DNA-binding beta-propeller fold protein YncE|nr:hypothetical protein [Solirubrobacteraceae bacterium]